MIGGVSDEKIKVSLGRFDNQVRVVYLGFNLFGRFLFNFNSVGYFGEFV